MIKLELSSVIIGMRLAKAVYDHEGRLLIEKGMVLQQYMIDRLHSFSIKEVSIDWESSPRIIEAITDDTRNRAIKHMEEATKKANIIHAEFIDNIKIIINDIINRLLESRNLLLYMSELRSIDDYTFHHSIDVCVYSLIIGISLKYNRKQLEDLGIGAMLHDIGKVIIPPEILNKPSSLNDLEYEEIKKHTNKGYEIVKKIPEISETSRIVVRDHHERYDGLGYPNGAIGKSIHEYARIVAVCDVYDALTTNRVYKSKIAPQYAIEYIIAMGNHQFDYDIIRTFLKNIVLYPVGSLVRLDNGDIANVVRQNRNWPTRPLVEIIKNKFGEPLEDANSIDLRRTLNRKIVEVL